MNERLFDELLKKSKSLREEDQELARVLQNKTVSRMIDAAHRETDRLEHHLLEMPLSVIIYQWVIIRLKSRPWRLLVPASLALGLLLQSLLTRINPFLLFLSH